jgi:ubiquinone/menaquinone biosynthesis C-methylase UbiE
VASSSIRLAYSTFVSSDLDQFATAVEEAYRVLRPGGRYVSVCVHPAFNGGHTTFLDDGSVLVSPGYSTTGYQSSQEYGSTIRSHVGAWHRPIAELINTFLDVGFQLEHLVEAGPAPLPLTLGLSVVKPKGKQSQNEREGQS